MQKLIIAKTVGAVERERELYFREISVANFLCGKLQKRYKEKIRCVVTCLLILSFLRIKSIYFSSNSIVIKRKGGKER